MLSLSDSLILILYLADYPPLLLQRLFLSPGFDTRTPVLSYISLLTYLMSETRMWIFVVAPPISNMSTLGMFKLIATNVELHWPSLYLGPRFFARNRQNTQTQIYVRGASQYQLEVETTNHDARRRHCVRTAYSAPLSSSNCAVCSQWIFIIAASLSLLNLSLAGRPVCFALNSTYSGSVPAWGLYSQSSFWLGSLMEQEFASLY